MVTVFSTVTGAFASWVNVTTTPPSAAPTVHARGSVANARAAAAQGDTGSSGEAPASNQPPRSKRRRTSPKATSAPSPPPLAVGRRGRFGAAAPPGGRLAPPERDLRLDEIPIVRGPRQRPADGVRQTKHLPVRVRDLGVLRQEVAPEATPEDVGVLGPGAELLELVLGLPEPSLSARGE